MRPAPLWQRLPLPPIDWRSPRLPSVLMLSFLVALLCLGVLFVESASADPDGSFPSVRTRVHLSRIMIGVLALVIIMGIHYRNLEIAALPLFLVGMLPLTVLLVVKFLQGGVTRWINLPWFTVQPSEIAKLSTVVMLAAVLKPRHRPTEGWGHLRPLAVMALPCAMVVLQPDLGTALMLPPVLLALLWVSGASRVRLTFYIGLGLLVIPVWYLLFAQPYQQRRVQVFLAPVVSVPSPLRLPPGPPFRIEPRGRPALDTRGDAYQITQSLIAIGSGGVTGRGLGQGPQNTLDRLPQAHNDFIFAVIGEEWGLAGTLAVVALYLGLLLAAAGIAYRTREPFGRLLAVGFTVLLAFQAFVNMAMTVGLAPVTGLPLPFVSYGGSSMVTSLAAIAVVLGIGMRPVQVLRPDGLTGGKSPGVRPGGVTPARRMRAMS